MRQWGKVFLIFALLTFFIGAAQADPADPQIQAINQQIATSPNNGDLYSKRAQRFDAMGDYASALESLKTNCELSTTADVKELCYLEVKDYMKLHNFQ